MRYVGIDFGGTNIKAGVVDAEGNILEEGSIPTLLQDGYPSAIERAGELARKLGVGSPGTYAGLGFGVPGLVNRKTGVVYHTPNLPQFDGQSMAADLARSAGVEREHVVMENDANVAALGEQWRGAGVGREDLMVVTLGTGIGGGVILGGRLFIGAHGMAGEIGHVCIDPLAPPCGSDVPGGLESICSATAAKERALAARLPSSDPGDLELLCDIARATAGPERDLLFEIGRDLGRGIAAPVVLFDINCFIFTGGFAASFDLLEEGVRAGLAERSFGDRQIDLLQAALPNSAGWMGAARLVRDLCASELG